MFTLPVRETTRLHCNLKSRAIYYPLEKSKNMTLSPHLHADLRFTLYTSQRPFAKAPHARGYIPIGGRSCAYHWFAYLIFRKFTAGRGRGQPQNNGAPSSELVGAAFETKPRISLGTSDECPLGTSYHTLYNSVSLGVHVRPAP